MNSKGMENLNERVNLCPVGSCKFLRNRISCEKEFTRKMGKFSKNRWKEGIENYRNWEGRGVKRGTDTINSICTFFFLLFIKIESLPKMIFFSLCFNFAASVSRMTGYNQRLYFKYSLLFFFISLRVCVCLWGIWETLNEEREKKNLQLYLKWKLMAYFLAV